MSGRMAEQLSSSTSTSPIEANNDNISDNNNNHKDNKNKENKENVIDPELFSCMLQPATADSDPDYIGVRRLLLFRKAESGVRRRLVTSFFFSFLSRGIFKFSVI